MNNNEQIDLFDVFITVIMWILIVTNLLVVIGLIYKILLIFMISEIAIFLLGFTCITSVVVTWAIVVNEYRL